MDEGVGNATITHTASSINADYNGGGVDGAGVPFSPGVNATATITDNDAAAIMLSETEVGVAEGGVQACVVARRCKAGAGWSRRGGLRARMHAAGRIG